MSIVKTGVLGLLSCCGIAASSSAQVQQTNPSGLPVWTNIVDLSVPFKGGYVARGTCPCVGTPTPENEADCGIPADLVNGGCNSTPNVFSAIALGETVCGTAQIGSSGGWLRSTGVADPTTQRYSPVWSSHTRRVAALPVSWARSRTVPNRCWRPRAPKRNER